MIDYILFCYAAIGWILLIAGIALVGTMHLDHHPNTAYSKSERRWIRLGWLIILSGILAPLSVPVLVVVLPVALCYGGVVLVKGPVRKSLDVGFGREAVEDENL